MDQQWEPVVLRKTKTPQQVSRENSVTVPKSARPNHKGDDGSGVNKRKLEQDDPTYSLPIVTREMGIQISQARCKLGLTQAQLAQKCNLKLSIIQEYEKGQGIYDRKNLNPICRALGITLKK